MLNQYLKLQVECLTHVRQKPESYAELCRQTELFDELVALWAQMQGAYWLNVPGYTFAHIVIADFNFEDNHLDLCLAEKDQWIADARISYAMYNDEKPSIEAEEQLAAYVDAIDRYFVWLRSLPLRVRQEEPEE